MPSGIVVTSVASIERGMYIVERTPSGLKSLRVDGVKSVYVEGGYEGARIHLDGWHADMWRYLRADAVVLADLDA